MCTLNTRSYRSLYLMLALSQKHKRAVERYVTVEVSQCADTLLEGQCWDLGTFAPPTLNRCDNVLGTIPSNGATGRQRATASHGYAARVVGGE